MCVYTDYRIIIVIISKPTNITTEVEPTSDITLLATLPLLMIVFTQIFNLVDINSHLYIYSFTVHL